MIQYLPVELSPASGDGLYFILCVWVHGHKQGRGNFQKKGMGTALLEAAEADARALGAKGMAAWGVVLPFWMRASWFRKHGYRKADKLGMMALMWKPFAAGAAAPSWIRPKKKPQPEEGKVVVTGLLNGWCPAMSMVHERARRAAAELGPPGGIPRDPYRRPRRFPGVGDGRRPVRRRQGSAQRPAAQVREDQEKDRPPAEETG